MTIIQEATELLARLPHASGGRTLIENKTDMAIVYIMLPCVGTLC
jgi:hypothetical protein